MDGEKSLTLTPTWAVATVITVMVAFGFFFQVSLKQIGKWLDKTKRKALLSALDKIKEELMLFGLLSLLMGHWITFVAKICVKSSKLSYRFFPCAVKGHTKSGERIVVSSYENNSFAREHHWHEYCPEGHESFASHESLEQLHRLLFVLGITHVSYSFISIALAMIKIYSWKVWENQAKMKAIQSLPDAPEARSQGRRLLQLTTFVSHHTSHPWSQHRVLVWLLCFTRQFWSSISHADYIALRFGFITKHQLPLTYDFHNYMLRSMEEEFRDIVGISVPLWIYAIFCIFLDFHGTNIYFWLSFLPAILILLIGTKLHRVVLKLAVEIMDRCPWTEDHRFRLRDELFWFGKPRLLLRLIQLISFQNAFEMATFLWSLWEIRDSSCFMDNKSFLVIRLTFGVVSQVWCSFITFPLYVIVTQMGSRFKKTVVAEHVRDSLHGWQRRVKAKRSSCSPSQLHGTSIASSDFAGSSKHRNEDSISSVFMDKDRSPSHGEEASASVSPVEVQFCSAPRYDSDSDDGNDVHRDNMCK